MRVIGIDPGTICCGYGIVETGIKGQVDTTRFRGASLYDSIPRGKESGLIHIASGDIRMNKNDPPPERLKILYDSLKDIICENKPSHLCIEKIFYHKSITSAFALGSARGIVMLLAAENNLPLSEHNSTELKMALTGYGRAEKRQVKEMVIRLLNLDPSGARLSEDATDALALCICHIHNNTGYSSRIVK
ncbi:MAG: crossover junction endodeoxyribonuclease RuvC [Nitrospirae bacterium]|nr:crossover junction endodeoxyribonuclease RuvC [Nitrospirota bacterium]